MAAFIDMSTMHHTIQDALDELCAPRIHRSDRERALATLEEVLVTACVPNDDTRLTAFLALQDTFECNIPSRVISWLATTTPRLESLLYKSAKDGSRDADAAILGKHAAQALSLVQGIALSHASSKRWLSRRYPLQVLLDLLLVSRHLPSPPSEDVPSTSRSVSGGRESLDSSTPATSLSSAVVDTLLCILVDSSPGIRAFEDANGCQVVVKILKRAGTPREVRMKCLEFLTFYLMDETSTTQPGSQSPPFVSVTPNPRELVSGLPRHSSAFREVPFTPSHSHTRSLASLSSKVRTSSSSSESGSTGTSSSSSSFSSMSSATSVESYGSLESSTPTQTGNESKPRMTIPTTPYVQHLKHNLDPALQTPTRKPGINGATPRIPNSRSHNRGQSLGVDLPTRQAPSRGAPPETPRSSTYIDTDAFGSPVMSPVSTPIAGPGQRARGLTLSSIASSSVSSTGSASSRTSEEMVRPAESRYSAGSAELRTTEEKKALLGSMLSNVDALVEGVRKAGIWGLA